METLIETWSTYTFQTLKYMRMMDNRMSKYFSYSSKILHAYVNRVTSFVLSIMIFIY